MGKIITFFNHKWWVGKTTLVHNVAFALADLWKKILVIDADPQMNLTAAMYWLSTSMEYSTDNTSKWSQYIQKYISFSEYLRRDLQGEPCSKEKFNAVSRTGNWSIDLISGDINLTSTEANIYGIITSNNDFFKEIPWKFEQSIRKNANDYDFVLIDTSPSASSIINALLVLSSDYFIAPVSPSFFSLQAVDNLSTIFQNWLKLLAPYGLTAGLRNGLSFQVKFLGVVVQLAKRFNGGWKANMDWFARATEDWITEVNKSVKNFHKYVMRTDNAISEEDFQTIFGTWNTPFIIEKCCDFTQKLRTIAEKEGIPVIYLNQDICKKFDKKVDVTKETGQYFKALTYINTQYRKIASSLVRLESN